MQRTNVLVWKAVNALTKLYPEKYAQLASMAQEVKEAIYRSCVFRDADGKPYFAWSVDLKGAHNVYDEPPGSLQLLPYYGFCDPCDEIWRNTVSMIRSPAYEYSFADAPPSGRTNRPCWDRHLSKRLRLSIAIRLFYLYN